MEQRGGCRGAGLARLEKLGTRTKAKGREEVNGWLRMRMLDGVRSSL